MVIIAVAVALGAGLLLTTLAGINAVTTLNDRTAWLTPAKATSGSAPTSDPLLAVLRHSYFHRRNLDRIDLAATGPHSPIPPGIPRLPGPGEYYASPALSALLRTTPADQLGDQFPGHEIGTIGSSALPAPTSLLIIIGHSPAELAHQPHVRPVTSIARTAADSGDNTRAAGLDLVLAVVAGAMIFPLLMFIGTATRLAAARREQRFAAMRLVGATPRQVAAIAAVEATVSAVAGTALAFGLFFLFRERVAAIPFTGAPFFPSDLSLNLIDVLSVAVGVPVAAAVVARLALRRVNISPLGVTRRVTPRPPQAYRLIPLALGLAELAYFLVGHVPDTSIGQVEAFLPGFLVVMAGLVIAGPWLTMVGARIMARRTSRPATLIAARRLADNPRAGFRAVSGLILALFVASVAVGVITTIVDHRGGPTTGPAATNLSLNLPPDTPPVQDSLRARLRAIPGVQGLAVVYAAPNDLPPPPGTPWTPPGLVSCAALAGHPDFGRCAPGAEVASVFIDLTFRPEWMPVDGTWPTAHVPLDQLSRLPIASLVVGTDGSTSALERARTVLVDAYPREPFFASTEAEWQADTASTLNQWKQLANVVILVSLVIAGSSLAVSVVGGLTDRKRPFSLLRLTGAPLAMLRRVVALETAVPLLAAAVVAIATGFLGAHLFLVAQMRYSLHAPGAAYYLIVLCGLAACLGIVGSTFPLLRRITGPETARNE
nr:FtsX-like permease family protein [Planosporangium thailandense]